MSATCLHATEAPAPAESAPEPWYRALVADAREVFSKKAWRDPPVRRFALGSAFAGAALYPLRHDIRQWVQEHRSASRTRWLARARRLGHGSAPLIAAAACFGASLATRNRRERETGWLVIESAAFAGAAALAGSFVLAAERPRDGDAVRFLDDGHGVSLDAALAAALVPPLRHQYLRVHPGDSRGRRVWKRAATVLLYTGAALVAYQRMDADAHWAPDAWLGTATGLLMGEILVRARRSRSGSAAGTRVASLPGPLAPSKGAH